MADNWIERLRESVNIVDIVGEYVQLRPRGRRMWACCPFHNEKTPSFEVDGSTQLFYCFGCHKGGNVYTFLMEMEHMEFMDAAKVLADRVGFEIPEHTGGPAISAQQRARVYDCNRAAAMYFYKELYSPSGANALAYLHKRGLDDRMIRRFGLGAAPQRGDQLRRELLGQGFTDEELQLAGLIRVDGDRVRDQFAERAMFPIINTQGRVLGFGGRVLDGGQPKYLNTADTIVFNKRRELYGLNMVERGAQRLILVEGYMDVVSLVVNGVDNAVATLGTALTPEQVRLISRRVNSVYVAYDGDGAGQNAIARALDMFDETDLEARVLKFPDGRDPDEFVREFGREAFDELPALHPTRWRLDRIEAALDLSEQDGRTALAIQASRVLAALKNPVERESYLPDLMVKTGMPRDTLLAQIATEEGRAPATVTTRTPVVPRQSRGGARDDSFAPDNIKAERMLLLLMSQGLCPEGAVIEGDFSDELDRKLAAALLQGRAPSSIMDELESDERDTAASIFGSQAPVAAENAGQMITDCLLKLRLHRLRSELGQLQAQLSAAGDAEKQPIMEQMRNIMQEMNHMKSGSKGVTGI